MADPEQTDSKPLSRAGVDRNTSVQDGSDKVYNRPGTPGKKIIVWVSLIVAAIVAVLVGVNLF